MTRRRDEMRALLERRDQRGLTFKELSKQSGEPASTLAWWARKLRSEGAQEKLFAAVELVDSEADRSETKSGVWIHCAGVVIEVRSEFDPEVLRKTVEALSQC